MKYALSFRGSTSLRYIYIESLVILLISFFVLDASKWSTIYSEIIGILITVLGSSKIAHCGRNQLDSLVLNILG